MPVSAEASADTQPSCPQSGRCRVMTKHDISGLRGAFSASLTFQYAMPGERSGFQRRYQGAAVFGRDADYDAAVAGQAGGADVDGLSAVDYRVQHGGSRF